MDPNLPVPMPNGGSVPTGRPNLTGLDDRPRAERRLASSPDPAQPAQPARGRSEIRIGDVERSQVCDELSAAFAAGRLDADELDDRLAQAVAARTRRQLTFLVHDLGQPSTSRRPVAARQGPVGPSWKGLDILAVLLLIGCTVSVAGMLLLISGVSATWFFGSVVGGTLAFVAGASACQLMHRVGRQLRESGHASETLASD